jgi:hypothetical protein
MVPKAPITMPGKKPAAKERPSKPDCVPTGAAGQEEVCEAEDGWVAEGVGREDVGDEEGEVESLKHMLPLQENPNGQQRSPQVGNVTPFVSERCI